VDNAVSERGAATTRLGSFEIVRRLARGGMAEIFLACTRGPSGFEKLVVLKKILPKFAGRPRFVQLFLEEAKLAASLDHPNIVQVYDIGMVDGSYFFTMEYLHGQDVRSILHRAWRTGEKFPIEHAVQIARHVASALHFAHEKRHSDGALLGIVHRDVSPSNIIVTYDGATKLLDFGVAKTTASTVKTRTGALKGKISYMSPEQARGVALDRRSDVFSLGIVLWEMVTTQRLFRADNDLATLQLIINQPPRPPSAARPDCPPELEHIVLRALAQDPDARYQTAEQLVLDLDELAREHKLKQSSNALAAGLGELFGPEIAAWQKAREAGVGLADHLNGLGDLTTPVSASDFIELDAGAAALDEIEALYERDEDDEDDDDEAGGGGGGDDEKTEHMPVFEPLSSVEKTEHMPAYVDPPHTAAQLADSEQTPAFADPVSITNGSILSSEPTSPPTVVARPRGGRTPGSPFAPIAPQVQPSSRSSAPSPAEEPSLTDSLTPTPAMAPRSSHASLQPPMSLLAMQPQGQPLQLQQLQPPGSPFAISSQSIPTPFVAPPWKSGQPSNGGHTDRVPRSWALIELPVVDPVVFERQRRIVLRIAGAMVGVIVLLAILAGRC
jgi:serine/threonine protein kinase